MEVGLANSKLKSSMSQKKLITKEIDALWQKEQWFSRGSSPSVYGVGVEGAGEGPSQSRGFSLFSGLWDIIWARCLSQREKRGENGHPVIQENLQKTYTDTYNIPTYIWEIIDCFEVIDVSDRFSVNKIPRLSSWFHSPNSLVGSEEHPQKALSTRLSHIKVHW